jgi:hypothetical protein
MAITKEINQRPPPMKKKISLLFTRVFVENAKYTIAPYIRGMVKERSIAFT